MKRYQITLEYYSYNINCACEKFKKISINVNSRCYWETGL